jgi:hypothetical protein
VLIEPPQVSKEPGQHIITVDTAYGGGQLVFVCPSVPKLA